METTDRLYIEGLGTEITAKRDVKITVEEYDEVFCSPECMFINFHEERLKQQLHLDEGYQYTRQVMCKRYDHFFHDENFIRCEQCLKEFPSMAKNILFFAKCPVCGDNSSLIVRKEKDKFIGTCVLPNCKFCTGYQDTEKDLLSIREDKGANN